MSVHSPYCDTRRGGACSCRGQADRDIAYLETLQPGESSHITNDSDVPNRGLHEAHSMTDRPPPRPWACATTTPEGKVLLYRADCARKLVIAGRIDPALALSYVVWPTLRIEAATQEARAA